MKKLILSVALFSSIALAGCQSDDKADQPSEDQQTATSESVMSDSDSSNKENSSEEKTNKEKPFLYEVNQDNYAIDPIKDDTETQVALLTIDDAPDKHAVEMAKKLKDIKAPAIFFINGMYIESDEGKEKLKEIYDMGFEIGNHTQTHANLKEISEEKQKEEILTTSRLIEEVIGEKPRFFRAPFGANTDYSRSLAKQEKMTLMNWTYGYDWVKEYQDSAALKDIMLNTEYLRDGANLLMHDRDWTNDAIVDIAKGLRDKGYTLVDPETIISVGSEESTDE
ncbi:MAG: polysaccharide deacetylase family protein [Pisciglobus halotolerans]|nr:polysaccharide deacetylase family protein [Pisciglobus halotolerans]